MSYAISTDQSRPASRIKALLPARLQHLIACVRNRHAQTKFAHLSLSETFSRIYESGAWAESGRYKTRPYSGPGSNGRYLEQYCAMLQPQLAGLRVSSLADLGCGDFTVGRILSGMVRTYIGVDISDAVVKRNRADYSTESTRFLCADLTRADLPPADLAIVRQVLQHLSNGEVQLALSNLRRTYRHALITEHVFVGTGCRPNLDICHGPRTRVPFRSGVFVDQPPFGIPALWISDIPYAPDEVLRTWLMIKDAELVRPS